MEDNHETKNANDKVDILYNSWLGIADVFRTAAIEREQDQRLKRLAESFDLADNLILVCAN